MTFLDRPVRADPVHRPASRIGAVVRGLLASVVAMLALWVGPQGPQATHATDGELLAWVEAQDGRDLSAGLVDAIVVASPHALVAAGAAAAPGPADGSAGLVAGACGTRTPSGLPAADAIGCELPKTAGDLPEGERAAGAGAPDAPGPRRTSGVRSDPVPRQAHLPRPLRPPTA